ncbi:unnamed protein product, partial [Amoebophrya sp. A25]
PVPRGAWRSFFSLYISIVSKTIIFKVTTEIKPKMPGNRGRPKGSKLVMPASMWSLDEKKREDSLADEKRQKQSADAEYVHNMKNDKEYLSQRLDKMKFMNTTPARSHALRTISGCTTQQTLDRKLKQDTTTQTSYSLKKDRGTWFTKVNGAGSWQLRVTSLFTHFHKLSADEVDNLVCNFTNKDNTPKGNFISHPNLIKGVRDVIQARNSQTVNDLIASARMNGTADRSGEIIAAQCMLLRFGLCRGLNNCQTIQEIFEFDRALAAKYKRLTKQPA